MSHTLATLTHFITIKHLKKQYQNFYSYKKKHFIYNIEGFSYQRKPTYVS